jgi:phytoene dehydrogenase-like protein
MAAEADLLVLGAGPAGLAAAWRAARRGQSVLVLERAENTGGMAASFEIAGMSVDYGSHRLSPATPPHILADLRALPARPPPSPRSPARCAPAWPVSPWPTSTPGAGSAS